MRRLSIPLALLLVLGGVWFVAGRGLDDGDAVDRASRASSEEVPRAHGADANDPTAPPPTLGGGGVSPDRLADDECGILGRVFDVRSGEPVAGVRVYAVQWFEGHLSEACHFGTAVSDEEGHYRLRGIEGGLWSLRVIACGGGWVSAFAQPNPREGDAVACTVALAGGVWSKHDVAVLPGAEVRGVVLRPDGRPAAAAKVHAESLYAEGSTHQRFPWFSLPPTPCDADGRFTLDGLPPACEMGVVAALEGYVDVSVRIAVARVGEPVETELRFDAPRRVLLDVVDEAGAPVPEAKVAYGWWLDPRGGYEEHEASATEGKIELPLLPPRPFRIEVEAAGFVPVLVKDDAIWEEILEAKGEGTWTGRVVLERVTYVEGRIERPAGFDKERIGVEVKAVHAEGYEGYEAQAEVNSDDTFRVPTPPSGTYRLTFKEWTERRLYEAQATVDAGASDVVLRPELTKSWAEERTGSWARWRVTVLGPDGNPVPEADLDIESCGKVLVAPGHRYGLGPKDGGTAVFDVREEAFGAWLIVNEWETDEPRTSVFGPFGPEGGEVTVRVPPRQPIAGRLLTPDGAPIQGVEIAAKFARPEGAPEHWESYAVLDWTWTDADGNFVFRRIRNADVLLEVQAAGRWTPPPSVRVAAGSQDVEIRVLEQVTCRLTVLGPNGAGIEEGAIYVEQQDGARGADAYYEERHDRLGPGGVAELDGLEPGGVYDLWISVRGDFRSLDVDGWTPKDETFRLEAETPVTGVVRDQAGRPLEGVTVCLLEPDGDTDLWGSRSDGTFRFRDVHGGVHHLWAFFPGARFHAGHPPLDEAVRVEGGDEGVELVLHSRRALEVVVERPPHADLTKSTVWLLRLRDPKGVGAYFGLAPNQDGTARFRGLEPGERYRLWYDLPDIARYALLEVGPDEDSVQVTMRPGGTVEGHVELPPRAENARVGVVEPGIEARADVRPDGSYRLRTLPPGAWTLEARCEVRGKRRAKRTPATVRAGERADFDLTAP